VRQARTDEPFARTFRQQIGRITCSHRDHARERIGAVQAGRRAAQEFDALQQLRVDQVAPRAREAADGEAIAERNAIEFHRDAIAFEATDREPLRAEAACVFVDAEGGVVAGEIADVANQSRLDLAAFDQGHRSGDVADRLFDPAGDNDDGIERGRPARFRIGGEHGQGQQGQGDRGTEGMAAHGFLRWQWAQLRRPPRCPP
jgi:hypothetical protein